MSLADQAQALAASLTETLNLSVCDGADLQSVEAPDSRFFLGHKVSARDLDGSLVPVIEFAERLFLRVHWRFGPNSTGEYLRTEWSQFGLFVWSPKAPHPLFRLEVDAESDPEAWNVAHIQVHATSQLLGQVWGLRGVDRPRRLESLHLPVGGFQYRPCLEDFVEFLIEEELVPAKKTWRSAIEATRSEYRKTQLQSLVAKNRDFVREVMTGLDRESE